MAEQLRFGLCILVAIHALTTCTAADTISANQILKDGQTLISAKQTFELGFFSPTNSTNRYVGIWYKHISPRTVICVANRNTPLVNTSGELTLTPQGVLVIRNTPGDVIWSSGNTSAVLVNTPVSQLLDTGNLVVRGDQDGPIWQSFDYPTDTFVPGMKFGKDFVTGRETHFTSWKEDSDPSSGEYTVWLDTQGYPQMIVRDGVDIRFRAGPWNGVRFSGEPSLRSNSVYRFGFSLNEKEMYYYFDDLLNSSVITRVVIRPTGIFERLLWIESQREWLLYLATQNDNCDRYKLCGSYGSCNINNYPACGCLKGFEPTSPDQWNVADWSQGCKRLTPLDCGPDEGFRKYSGVKLPDTQHSWFDQTMSLDECERFCKRNCSCTAYASQNITGGGSGCLVWFGELLDIRTFAENEQDLYIRMPASELAKDKSSDGKKLKIILPIVLVLLFIIVSLCIFCLLNKRKPMQEGTQEEDHLDAGDTNSKDNLELPLIDFSILRKATDNFSDNNKLGEGGFGPVYKGVMENGQEVAVKRLSKTSTQGLIEFKNEVITISKLQHRNLVRLLGCCIKGVEKMLVYEYMPNKSLDTFIFGIIF
ncbi:G-type lectin S-receptor-like serine/threonine-protein kinase At4g27290 [Bidens hawaiensis]|uniref:G-type lectin S-receptor-like serine/threonine-protein kinase At4g27290 n=1 Tax=Bidens hawaiensis TaxID=980011 RepID=UPI004049A77A